MRSAPVVLAVLLLAGCSSPPAPPDGGATTVQIGLLGAFGDASWSFHPDHPVLLLSAPLYTVDEATKHLRYPSRPLAPGDAVLRLEGFGPNAWASLPASSAQLVLSTAAANATFIVLLSARSMTVEQLGPEGVCAGTVSLSTGTSAALGPGPWTYGVPPGVSAIFSLTGPEACDGTTLRTSHLGMWTATTSTASAP